MATQYTCSLNSVYCPYWLVQWNRSCSHMCIPVHSPWLPGYIDVMQMVLIILTMAGLYLTDFVLALVLWIICPCHLQLSDFQRKALCLFFIWNILICMGCCVQVEDTLTFSCPLLASFLEATHLYLWDVPLKWAKAHFTFSSSPCQVKLFQT